MRFTVTAIRADGSTFQGVREAHDRQSLLVEMRGDGLKVVAVSEAPVRWMTLNIEIFSRVPTGEKIIFARNLAAMLKAGLSVSRALDVLERQSKNKAFKKIIRGILDEVTRGASLHEAFSHFPKVFPPLFIAMTRAGEESGTLSESLAVVGVQMDRAHQLTKKVRGAMMYPLIVTVVMIIIFVLMLMFVVPTLSATFKDLNADLPLMTQALLTVSAFMVNHYVLFIISMIAAGVGIWGVLRMPQGKWAFDWGLVKAPVIGTIVKNVNTARTARTLSSLLKAGVPALTALTITGEVVQNSLFKPVIAHAGELVQKGKPISAAFAEAEEVYPVMFGAMTLVGEETGDLSAMLLQVADFYEGEVEQQTKDLSTIIEPLLMVVIGGGVGFFAIAMISPIYSLSSSV